MRELWLQIHRWLGLGIGLFFFIAALTGAVLVYEHELDAWLNRGEYRVTPGDVGMERVLETAQVEAPGTLFVLRWPQPRERVYVVEMVNEADRIQVVRVDPGSGDVAQRTRPNIPVIRLIRRAHTTLLAGRPGHYVVLVASVLALFSLATGLVLWWPGIRRFVQAFAVRLRRGFYPFNFDLHQATGALLLVPLFVITLTGILIPYQPLATQLVRLVTREEAGGGWGGRPRAAAGEPLAAGQLLSVARAQAAGEPTLLRMPRRPGDAAVVELLQGPRMKAGSIVGVFMDPTDASVLQVRDPRRQPRATRIAGALNFNLHVGAVGGPVVRVLYVLICLAGAWLAIGGFLIWWLKRERIQAAARRRADG